MAKAAWSWLPASPSIAHWSRSGRRVAPVEVGGEDLRDKINRDDVRSVRGDKAKREEAVGGAEVDGLHRS